VQRAAERFRFDEGTLVREAGRLRSGAARPAATPAPASREKPDVVGRLYVARLLAGEPVGEEDLLPETVLREDRLRRLYARWRELTGDGESDPKGRLLAEETTRNFAAEVLAGDDEETGTVDLITRLRERVVRAQGRALREAIQDAESRGDRDEVDRLLRELHALKGSEG
jgi:hypothetical protein